jgi:hypothetical protein
LRNPLKLFGAGLKVDCATSEASNKAKSAPEVDQ